MTRNEDAPIQSVVQQLLSCLKADSRSASEIAHLAAVSQPTVSRLRRSNGQRQRASKSFNKLCSFYNVPTTAMSTASRGYDELLQAAIIDAWDGTEASGRALLAVIEGLKEFKNKQMT
ncbi:MAG: XRE family transcriptional regulator [Pantanalinema sp. GBBB05]|nr:XRE family transcriptional regulator [Pantanalinema sp. GBBB05]